MTNMQKTNYLDTIVQYDIPIGGTMMFVCLSKNP